MKRIMAIAALAMGMMACSAGGNGNDAAAENTDNQKDTVMNTVAEPTGPKVLVKTTAGDFTVLLYDETPRHRDNFLKLASSGDYDGTLFHRVIKDFMVQAGDPDSKNAPAGKMLGSGEMGEPIPAEIVFPRFFHKRGALAAARQGDQVNPERKSSASQFYVVTGKKVTANELDRMDYYLRQNQMQDHFNGLAQQHRDEIIKMQADNDTVGLRELQDKLIEQTEAWAEKNAVGMTPEMRKAYQEVGGAPHLDGQYTVFGEVIDGMDTIEKIQQAETGRADRPVEDIKILSMKVLD